MRKLQYFSLNILKQKDFANFFSIVFILFFQFALADGTKQVSPGNNNGTASTNGTAYLINPDGASGSYPGSAANTKMRVTITNFNTERILSGFMARTLSTTNTTLVTNAYIRITNPSNVVVFQSVIPSSGAGSIADYSQAWNGPNLGTNTAGYIPFNYTPTANGEYIIELYRSNDGGNTAITSAGAGGQITFPLFDISVATITGTAPSQTANVISGRLWSREWSFVTTNLSSTATGSAYPNVITASFNGSFFVYTNDGFKAQVIFRPNFRPLGFQLVMNYWGIANTGNFANDSKSRNGTFTAPNTIAYPAIPEGYRVFLTGPDSVAFPNGSPGNPAITGAIYGCPGAYYIPYYVDKAGDVAITLDLDGTPGYQAGGADRVLQAYDIPVGNNVMNWDGLNGVGGTVPISFSVTVSVLLLQGRVNIPMIDAELNTNGFSATAIFPNLGNRPMFWDDTGASGTGLTAFGSAGNSNSNLTTGGTRTPNLRSGILGPTHAWDGSNPTLATPAPLTANQGSNTINTLEDDFGNARIINTWFYGSESQSPSRTLSLPGCDNDFDGIDNNADLDDDNDGILDTVENRGLTDPLGDHDGDGVPNYIDPQFPGFVDTNFDGVDDRYDADLDGVINQFDTDADGDGCADAIEGSEYVTAAQIHSLTLATTDSNYPYRGQIRVLANGTTQGTPAQIRNTDGVPLLVNPGGVADNTDVPTPSSEVGQGLGISQNASINGCTDSDNDGIPDADDLDDDNDGILDTAECTSGVNENMVSWMNSNATPGVYPATVQPNYIGLVTGTNSTAGSGLTRAQGSGGFQQISGVDATTEAAAAQNNEYVEYKITVGAQMLALDQVSYYKATSSTAYTFSVKGSADNFATSFVVNTAISYGAMANNTTVSFDTPQGIFLSPNTTYTFRVYFYAVTGGAGGTIEHDDFILKGSLICDNDNDGIPNRLDLDSDADGCPDAIEGSEAVTSRMINPMTAALNPGQISVIANGTGQGSQPSLVISTLAAARGVPQVVNNGANNFNATNNTNNTAGIADNTDSPTPSADIGQGVGTSANAAQQDIDCRCFKPANTATAGLPTNHGITALGRAGANNGNWPMKITGAYTVLDAKTKGFVINRLTTTQIMALTPVRGMMAYDTTENCLKIYDGTTWACYTQQTCDQY